MKARQRWSVYLLRCKDGSLYAGITTDIEHRLAVHNAGKGAKYTRSRLPVRLVWKEAARSEGAARRREHEIKTMARREKLGLVREGGEGVKK